MAVAVENARLVAELDARQRDLALVRRIEPRLRLQPRPRTVIEAVVERLVALLGVGACDIHVLEPGLDAVRTVVSYDDGRFDFGDVVAALVVDGLPHRRRGSYDRRPVADPEPRRPASERVERRLLHKNGKTSQLGVPLQARDRVIGRGRALRRHAQRAYSPEEVELVEAICQFAALALDNAHLYDSQRETAERLDVWRRQLGTLQQVSLKLGRLRDEPAWCARCSNPGRTLLEADIAAYAVRDGEVVAVKAFYDRDGFSAPDAAAAESMVTVLRDALPEIGAIEIGDGVAQLSVADMRSSTAAR